MFLHYLVRLPAPTENVVQKDLNSKMINLTFLVIVCTISAVYLQEMGSYNSFPSFDEPGISGYPLKINYGEPKIMRTKPCAHRRNNVQAVEQWIPSFRSMVTKPLNNDALKPQALKNEKVDNVESLPRIAPGYLDIAGDEYKVTNILSAESSLIKESNNGINDANVILNGLTRRSNTEERPYKSDEHSANEDYDCDIDLETGNYYDSESRRLYFSNSGPITTQPTVGIEQKVIEMLRDCINKKQKYIEDKINQPNEIPLAGSRRSMGGSDFDNGSNSNLKPLESDYDKIKKSTVAVETNTETNLNARVSVTDNAFRTPSFTLRPGKLFNELQHPTKATGIANIPVSRRMLADNSRVCYACSTATNPSCWKPDTKTTIKYCREDQNCVTKSFGEKDSLTVLRDCAKSCEDTGVAGIEPQYKACSVCYKDLCNSAAINSYNLVIVLLISAIKCTF